MHPSFCDRHRCAGVRAVFCAPENNPEPSSDRKCFYTHQRRAASMHLYHQLLRVMLLDPFVEGRGSRHHFCLSLRAGIHRCAIYIYALLDARTHRPALQITMYFEVYTYQYSNTTYCSSSCCLVCVVAWSMLCASPIEPLRSCWAICEIHSRQQCSVAALLCALYSHDKKKYLVCLSLLCLLS